MKPLSSILVLSLIAPGVIAQETDIRKILGIDNTVGAIQALENQRDPKCDATAARLENFMYGTPLSHEGRLSKVELQKRLISTVWKDSSDAARKAGADSISVDVLRPAVAKALPYTVDDAKNVYVTLGDGSKLLLQERDIRQYGSVAYGLRAILATQQDALLTPGVNLVPLSTEAVQLMKEMVDVYTLAALNLSDRAARKDGQKELTAPVIADAWKTIAPASATVASAVLKPASSTTQPGAVLRKIIDQKLVSFRTYNAAADPLLYSNIQTYYARHPWPTDIEEIKKITAAFTGAVMGFIGDSLVHAQQKAKTAGDPVVREKHVAAVFDERAPYAVNIYEDVIFFANLPKARQVYIEAYDADSLRDSGLHWHLIKQVIDSPGFPLELDLDPFAAELLAEGDAQMAVLLFRVAGEIAKEKGDAVLSAGHVEAAQARIKERFAEHLKTKKTVNTSLMIASAPSASRPAAGQKHFSDGTERSGIDFLHRSSDWLNRFQRTFLYSLKGTDAPDPRKEPAEDLPPSFSGSGVAAEDINGDGRADLLLLSGLGNKLYLNKGGSFEDVTEKAGINWIGPDGKPGEPRQPVIADFDNDGRQDILITYVNASHRLYRNLGDGRFADVTTTAKFGGEDLVGGPAVAFDYDRDGLLDVYIGYYGNYIKGIGPNLARVNHNATPNKLFRNKGGFAFEDVSRGSGVENDGWTQAVASVDFNLDGWADLIVGNDFGVNAYYRNLGNGKFEDAAPSLGTDLPSSSMNVGVSDLNKDGYPDVYISNIVSMVKDEKYVLPTEATKMKRNPVKLATMRVVQNNHLFTSIAPAKDRGLQYALNEAIDPADTSTGWAWDADFFDFDNDGDDDLYVVNGLHEYYFYASEFNVSTAEGDKTMVFAVNDREPNVFFVNEKGRLVNRSSDSGADFSGNSRAAAYLDVDEDGDLDVVINNFNEKAIVLLNRSERTGNNWVKVKLVGDPSKGTNADAVGARVIATTPDGNRIWREVQSATGYMSVHPKEQHFGLGKQKTVDLVVYWPNGERREYKNLEANQVHRIKQ